MANSIPSAPIAFPRRAVLGDDSSLSPTMKSTAATRYVSAITRVMPRVGSELIWIVRVIFAARRELFARRSGTPEHSEHPIRDEEAADDIDRRQRDRRDAEDRVVRR